MSTEFAAAELTMGQLNALVKKLGGPDRVRQILADVVKTVTEVVSFLTSTTKQVVNYDRSIADSLMAGKYDWKNDNITDANFPSDEKGQRKVEFGVFHFNKTTESDDNVAKMKAEGFRPATMKELLAYGEKNPKEQRKYPIIALGLVARLDGRRPVGDLRGSSGGRDADLGYDGLEWRVCCRFLGVRI